jgi:hypothetical protein
MIIENEKKKCPNGDNGSILPEKGGGFGSTPDLGTYEVFAEYCFPLLMKPAHIEDVNSNLNR